MRDRGHAVVTLGARDHDVGDIVEPQFVEQGGLGEGVSIGFFYQPVARAVVKFGYQLPDIRASDQVVIVVLDKNQWRVGVAGLRDESVDTGNNAVTVGGTSDDANLNINHEQGSSHGLIIAHQSIVVKGREN